MEVTVGGVEHAHIQAGISGITDRGISGNKYARAVMINGSFGIIIFQDQ
ncbi:MAG: hypothetical protein GF329_01210 [Candidatus Lokiarchaeota archaeon]|nr:hypothetical protein [Candidatus Lokiarchaeota archaeon]